MELKDFSSFFEILAALNFIYAGSETFRNYLNNVIFRRNRQALLIDKLQILCAEIYIASAETKDSLYSNALLKPASLFDQEHAYRNLFKGFQSTFLITGLFCLTVLILSGFENHSFGPEEIYNILLFLNGILFFNIFVFFRSFFLRNHEKNVKLIYPILLIALFVLGGVIFKNYATGSTININAKLITSISLIVCLSPYILYFLRYSLHILYFEKDLKVLIKEFELFKLTYLNHDYLTVQVKNTLSDLPESDVLKGLTVNERADFSTELKQKSRELEGLKIKQIITYFFFLLSFFIFTYSLFDYIKVYFEESLGRWAEISIVLLGIIISSIFTVLLRIIVPLFTKKDIKVDIRKSENELYQRFQKNIDAVLDRTS